MASKKSLFIYAAYFVLYEVSTYLANDMIMPGMVNVIYEFNAPISEAATSLTYFILGGCTLPLLLTHIIKILGKRKVLLFGNALFLFATLIIALAQNIDQFLWARLFQGMGLGFIFIGYITVHELFDDLTAVKIIAILGNVSLMAPLLGPIIGGAITSSYNWRFVFILVGLLAGISLYGLYRYMPNIGVNVKAAAEKPTNFIHDFLSIIRNKLFLLGVAVGSLNNMVNTNWTGISPVIVFNTYKEPFANYATYQVFIFSGTTISSIAMQFITKNLNISKLIKYGSVLSITGLVFSFACSFSSKILYVFGLFMFTLGAGLYIGVINRILMSSLKEYAGTVAALYSVCNSLLMCIGLEVANYICSKISYTFPTLGLINLLLGIVSFSLTRYFAFIVKERSWS